MPVQDWRLFWTPPAHIEGKCSRPHRTSRESFLDPIAHPGKVFWTPHRTSSESFSTPSVTVTVTVKLPDRPLAHRIERGGESFLSVARTPAKGNKFFLTASPEA